MRNAEAHVRRILEKTPIVVVAVDRAGICTLSEGRALAALGCEPGDLVGRSVDELFPDAPAVGANLRRALAGETFSAELQVRGTWWSQHYAPIQGPAGDVIGAVGIGVDITDRRELEDERDRWVERLQELDRTKDRLIANVSHELRTPLTLVLGAAERLAARCAPDAPEQQELALIERSAHDLLGQVEDLLEVSRAAGTPTLDYAAVDLAARFRAALVPFQRTAEHHGLHFVVQAPDQLPAEVDPSKVQRILANLLTNAFRAVPPGGTVRATLSARGAVALLCVADSGPGVPPEDQARVFEGFYRGDDPGGSGLGLTIAKDLAERHGGAISVGTADEGGAAFTVELPLRAPSGAWVRPDLSDGRGPVVRPGALRTPALPHGPSTDASLAAPTSPRADDDRPVVVLAEDNAELNRFLTEMLSRDFRVLSARDGEEALRLAQGTPPDLVVTDLMMPRMTGEELLAEVRGSTELQGVPVIVITAWDDRALRVRLLREGAQDYVTKPFSTEELRARAANLVALKRTRDVLQSELESRRSDVESLARELGQRRRELEEALGSAQAARRQAEDANRARGEFLALLSHELRTPVHALKLRHAVLERKLGSGDGVLEQVRGVAASAERLYRLFDTLLDFARLEHGPTRIRRAPTDLRQLVADLVDEARPVAEAKGLAVRFTSPAGLPALDSDPALLRIALGNVLANAVKFTPGGDGRGPIEVLVDQVAGGHRVSVTDPGPGIPMDAQERIFEPFVHLEPLRGKHLPGVGLGLPVARRLVEALGGTLTLTSVPGVGSTFTVLLPPPADVELAWPGPAAAAG